MKNIQNSSFRAVAFAAALGTPTVAKAQAPVFVEPSSGYAWWVTEPQFLPQSKTDSGVGVSDINAWINANRGMKVETSTCFMSFVRDDQVVSSNRAVHDDIRARLRNYPNSFDQSFESASGKQFRVRVGVFEDCDERNTNGDPLRYMAVVVTDENNRVREFDALTWYYIRLFKTDEGKINALGCYECGEVTQLNCDEGNDRFYWEWVGH